MSDRDRQDAIIPFIPVSSRQDSLAVLSATHFQTATNKVDELIKAGSWAKRRSLTANTAQLRALVAQVAARARRKRRRRRRRRRRKVARRALRKTRKAGEKDDSEGKEACDGQDPLSWVGTRLTSTRGFCQNSRQQV